MCDLVSVTWESILLNRAFELSTFLEDHHKKLGDMVSSNDHSWRILFALTHDSCLDPNSWTNTWSVSQLHNHLEEVPSYILSVFWSQLTIEEGHLLQRSSTFQLPINCGSICWWSCLLIWRATLLSQRGTIDWSMIRFLSANCSFRPQQLKVWFSVQLFSTGQMVLLYVLVPIERFALWTSRHRTCLTKFRAFSLQQFRIAILLISVLSDGYFWSKRKQVLS